MIRQIRAHDAPFALIHHPAGLEVACRNQVRGRPNRSRLRIQHYEGEGSAVIFFRVSSAPGGQDRYGYGGLAVRADRLRPDQTAAWLDYLASGLDVGCRPRGLQRAHQFPVPD